MSPRSTGRASGRLRPYQRLTPREVGVDVVQHLHALGAGGLQRGVLLSDHLRAYLGGRLVRVELADELDRPHAGDVQRRGDPVVARLVDQQAAILREHVAGAEHDAVVRVGVDVRDAVGVAPDARRERARAHRVVGDQRRVVGGEQPRRLEVTGAVGARLEHGVRDVAAERRQPVVHQRLRVGRQHPRRRRPRARPARCCPYGITLSSVARPRRRRSAGRAAAT